LTVTPGARVNRLERDAAGAWRVRVAAPAAEGKANRELLRYLAAILDLPPSALGVARGVTSRHKVVLIHGLSNGLVLQRLEKALEGKRG
jgi:uncharacterized protein YggU (UPF0235/DUF167 family)